MEKDYQAIIREIIGHITKKCKYTDISEFYVGLSDDPELSLFSDHNVSKEFGCWTYSKALNEQHAGEVVKRLVEQGMMGSSGEDNSGVWVYCYKIGTDTYE